MMRIEVGLSYKTRDGSFAQILRLSGNASYPYEGTIARPEALDAEEVIWNREGYYLNRSNPDENDLVEKTDQVSVDPA